MDRPEAYTLIETFVSLDHTQMLNCPWQEVRKKPVIQIQAQGK